MPQYVWDELVKLAPATIPPSEPRSGPPERERQQVEKELEDWLADHVDALEPLLGFPVVLQDRQLFCGYDHGGVIDLLLRRTDRKNSYIVAELKAGEVRRDAVAQVLGYLGWLGTEKRVKETAGIVIGLDLHPQTPWVLRTVPALVSVHHWHDLGLPAQLRAKVDWAGTDE